jgi:hypothetical protein
MMVRIDVFVTNIRMSLISLAGLAKQDTSAVLSILRNIIDVSVRIT